MNSYQTLKLFTDASVLRQVGRNLLTEFFARFANLNPRLPNPKPENEEYFADLARIMERPNELPDPLSAALKAIDAAALATNAADPDPNNEHLYLERAIRDWLLQNPHSPNSDASRSDRGGDGPSPSDPSLCTSSASHSDPPRPDAPPAAPHTNNGGPDPSLSTQNSALCTSQAAWLPDVEPWPDPVDGAALLDTLAQTAARFVFLPKFGPETVALMVLHTYAFHLRDFTVYLGIDSPTKRCGKSTLLTLLRHLVNRPVLASNISPSALFRVIQQVRPTLLIDEADRLLRGNNKLKGILNAGYHRSTGFVVRVVYQPASAHKSTANPSAHSQDGSAALPFSSWCPKAIATIGRLPDTLADRCIVIHMHRKTRAEQRERLRNIETIAPDLRRQCARFVLDHQTEIAKGLPPLPESLNDRAADLWEPLFILADIAGGRWPELARQAALALSNHASETNPITSLFIDILICFASSPDGRLFTRDLVRYLNADLANQPWAVLTKGKPINDLWLSQQLRRYGIAPKVIWIGKEHARGYCREDFLPVINRYVPKADLQAFLEETSTPQPEQPQPEAAATPDVVPGAQPLAPKNSHPEPAPGPHPEANGNTHPEIPTIPEPRKQQLGDANCEPST